MPSSHEKDITVKVETAELIQPDELGRQTVALDDLVPYSKNPRNPEDFRYPGNPAFKELVESINLQGVLEPIQVFIANGSGPKRAHMGTGHRRREAVLRVNELRRAAREALLKKGSLGSADEKALQPILRLPVTVIPAPESDFDRQKGMWNSEVLREKWPFNKTIEFFKQTYDAAPRHLKDDPKELARNLGLPTTRVKLLVDIVNSPNLFDAARGDVLPLSGREKTLRSANRVANVVNAERPSVARTLTGAVVLNDDSLEQLRGMSVELAAKMPHAGVALEQIAPQLREVEKHSDNEVVQMLQGDVDAAKRIWGSFRPEPSRTSVADDLQESMKAFANANVKSMSPSELDARLGAITEMASLLDKALVEARAAKRAHV